MEVDVSEVDDLREVLRQSALMTVCLGYLCDGFKHSLHQVAALLCMAHEVEA